MNIFLIEILVAILLKCNVCLGQVDCDEYTVCEFTLEAANGYSSGLIDRCSNDTDNVAVCFNARSNAYDGLAVRLLKLGHSVNFDITLFVPCFFQVQQLSLSNDGESDTLSIIINNNSIVNVIAKKAVSNGANDSLWNNFANKTLNSEIHALLPEMGRIVLSIMLSQTRDIYGVELDTISVQFMCDGECPEVLPSHPREVSDNENEVEIIVAAVIELGVTPIVITVTSILISIVTLVIKIILYCSKLYYRI